MKTANYVIIVLVAAFCLGAVAYGGSADKSGYMGIRMDPRPLPDLLIKHLRLKDRQGVRIQNVGIGLPAEKAGLERDDIVIGLNGRDVLDSKSFADAVQQAGVGAEITLDVVHLGRRKTVKLKLSSFDEDSGFKPKFPPEPEAVQSWQPGRMFHLPPDAQSWVQVGPGGTTFGGAGGAGGFGGAGGGFSFGGQGSTGDSHTNTFFNEFYTFSYFSNGEGYTITIQGDPRDDDAEITVEAGKSSYKKRVKDIDKLPEQYRASARESVKKARNMSQGRRHRRNFQDLVLPKAPDQMFRRFDQRQTTSPRPPRPKTDSRQDTLELIQKELREMQNRIKNLEKEKGKQPRPDEPETTEDAAHQHDHNSEDSHSHEAVAI